MKKFLSIFLVFAMLLTALCFAGCEYIFDKIREDINKNKVNVCLDGVYYKLYLNVSKACVYSLDDKNGEQTKFVIQPYVEHEGVQYTVTEVGEYKFQAVGSPYFLLSTRMQEVFIPETVEVIHFECLELCDTLQKVDVHPNNPNYASHDGIVYTKDMKTLLFGPLNRGEYKKYYVLPSGVDEITVIGSVWGAKHIFVPSSVKKATGFIERGRVVYFEKTELSQDEQRYLDFAEIHLGYTLEQFLQEMAELYGEE
ncbi:MAG: hypothetical protein IKC52_00600 [Clostridia bacterium]|nr:hypothetical protein [Clostridia bacterium]